MPRSYEEIVIRREGFKDTRIIHEGRASNVHAHDLARSSLDLLAGRLLWLLNSPDPLIVPVMID
jgi:hypothetical protein